MYFCYLPKGKIGIKVATCENIKGKVTLFMFKHINTSKI